MVNLVEKMGVEGETVDSSVGVTTVVVGVRIGVLDRTGVGDEIDVADAGTVCAGVDVLGDMGVGV